MINIQPYDPRVHTDRFKLQDAVARLLVHDLTRTAPFHVDLIDGAYWLAKQFEDVAIATRPS